MSSLFFSARPIALCFWCQSRLNLSILKFPSIFRLYWIIFCSCKFPECFGGGRYSLHAKINSITDFTSVCEYNNVRTSFNENASRNNLNGESTDEKYAKMRKPVGFHVVSPLLFLEFIFLHISATPKKIFIKPILPKVPVKYCEHCVKKRASKYSAGIGDQHAMYIRVLKSSPASMMMIAACFFFDTLWGS